MLLGGDDLACLPKAAELPLAGLEDLKVNIPDGHSRVHSLQDEATGGVSLAGKQKQHLPMKIFFLVVAMGLLTSTVTGIYMSYRYERNKLLVTGTLIAGVMVPLILLRF